MNVYEYMMGGNEEESQTLFSRALCRDKGQWAQTETQEIPSEHKITLIYCQGGQTLEWIAQTGCGVSIHGGIQSPTGRDPGQPALADPVSAGVLDEVMSVIKRSAQL